MKHLSFSTQRLSVAHWERALNLPDQRRRLETRLNAMLTPPVLQHLPPSVQRDGSPDDITNWIAGRQAATDVYLVETSDDLIGAFVPVHIFKF